MSNEKAEGPGGEAVATVGIHHVSEKLCGGISMKVKEVTGIMKGVTRRFYKAGEVMYLVLRGLVGGGEQKQNNKART